MNPEIALKLLKKYSCIENKLVESEADKEQLRQAIQMITSLSEYENLGICADNAKQGFTALSSYLKALGYTSNIDIDTLSKSNISDISEKSIYIKYNTQKQTHYLDSYNGTYRGVLISCQGEDDKIVGTYGHFPLDLFN
jgi:Tfp pilus assembly protein PilF